MNDSVSLQTLQRMPLYLNYLRSAAAAGRENISAKAIADALSLGEIQVRKDLASVSDGGRPKVGYNRQALIRDVEAFLGYSDAKQAVLVGAGKLGRALMGYGGFQQYGLSIVAAFDSDPGAQGMDESGLQVYPLEQLPEVCGRLHIRIGIVTVPAPAAQEVCDRLVAGGVLAILNFAPAHLSVPDGVLVESENLAASLAQLSRHLRDRMS
jgi:redox-sensing transcriptional repressor